LIIDKFYCSKIKKGNQNNLTTGEKKADNFFLSKMKPVDDNMILHRGHSLSSITLRFIPSLFFTTEQGSPFKSTTLLIHNRLSQCKKFQLTKIIGKIEGRRKNMKKRRLREYKARPAFLKKRKTCITIN
jgi:hypothetical protein